MRRNRLFTPKQEDANVAGLFEECLRLRQELSEKDAVIRLITKAALALEQERDQWRLKASDDVPF
jgi:hypothetical protein